VCQAHFLTSSSCFKIPAYTDDYHEVCYADNVDLVCIATPPYLHYEMAIAAIRGRKHVLCEKPLAMDVASAQEIVETAARIRGRRQLVDHQLRFHRELSEVRNLVQSGKVGRPYLVRINQESSDFFRREPDWKWWFQEDLGGGLLFAMGPHLVDLALHYFGCCARVHACTELLPDVRLQNGKEREIEVEAAFCVTLMMESGVTVLVSATAAGCSPTKGTVGSWVRWGQVLKYHFSSGRRPPWPGR